MKISSRLLAVSLLSAASLVSTHAAAAPAGPVKTASPAPASPAPAKPDKAPASAASAPLVDDATIAKGMELAVLLMEEMANAMAAAGGDCNAVAKTLNAYIDANQARIDIARKAGAQASPGQASAAMTRLEARITPVAKRLADLQHACAGHADFSKAMDRTR